MSDKSLTIAAAIVEIGLPLSLSAAFFANVRNRANFVVVLGSVTPLMILYLVISFEYLVLHRKDGGWSFHAMRMMTFLPYVACAFLGSALVAGLIALGF
jgi:hypothetical protein